MRRFVLGAREIGDGKLPLVIAEIGINHGGDLKTAIRLADLAIDAGAEVIKHQTHIVDDEMSEEARKVIPGNSTRSIFDIMQQCALSEKDEFELMRHIESRGAIFLSSAFSRAAADRLLKFDVPGIKVGSGECNNYPLLKHIARMHKPVILSTGMNSVSSVAKAVEIFADCGTPLALLHCTNIYPTPPELVRLRGIRELQERFPDLVIGYSDHSTTIYPCLGAVALGADVIERHFTDTYERAGEDIICSMDPAQLKSLLEGIEVLHAAKGGSKGLVKEEQVTADFAFASVVAIKDIAEGELLTTDNIWVKRPAGGAFSAEDFEGLIDKVALRPIRAGRQLKREDI